jgi:hypothetical protein
MTIIAQKIRNTNQTARIIRDIMWKICIFLSHVRDERLTYPELATYRLTGE